MTASKIVLNAASGVGGAGLDVEEVFSTFLYTGNNTANRVINNGIDLAGEGGIVWTKIRYPAGDHSLWTTDIGAGYRLLPNETNAKLTDGGLTSFNNNGFTIQDNSSTNPNNNTMASWTFRKAPKFFDVVTWTGNGVAGREIPHNLGCAVGAMFIKRTDDSKYWPVYHRSTTATHFLRLNSTAAAQDSTIPFGDVEPTSTVFTVSGDEVVNTSGGTYVAYLFAHNNNDGEFGLDADADIIKCGVATISGDTTVDLGFEPQWVLYKNASANGNWTIIDSMRGWTADGAISALYPNTSGAESAGSGYEELTSTGFVLQNYTNGHNYVYIAIRRGTKVPESGTEVFDIDQWASGSPSFDSSFPVDFGLLKSTGSSSWNSGSRLTDNKTLNTNSTAAQSTQSDLKRDHMDGFWELGADSNYYGWMWKRAPNYFDVVAYTGNGTAGRTVSHNLGVAPEMMWVKQRPYSSDWRVYHSALGNTKVLALNSTAASATLTSAWNSTTPSSTVFTLGSSNDVNENPLGHIAYLFASLAGISKVGSYTGNGTSQTIDCGFSAGSRFVLIKRTDAIGDWHIYTSDRGIVAGNDPYLALNNSNEENAYGATDGIDPQSSGFIINQVSTHNLNVNNASYIFYAIA
jgi:hypothetical protein